MTSNGTVALRDGPTTGLAIRAGQEMFDDKQKAALAVLGIKNATSADLAVFMHYCQKTGLDPFSKQIYMLHRRENQGGQWVDKQTIQVGIDGFRVIRDRAARRDGVTVEYEDTRWYDGDGIAVEVWIRAEPPAACGMAVLKGGKRFPAVLTYAEYVQTKDGKPIGKWGSAPAHQLEKCAEAFALRRAFPHDLGGIYIEEEMPADAAVSVPQRPQRVTAAEIVGNSEEPPHHGGRAATRAQVGKIQGEFKRLNFTEEEREARLAATARLAGLPGLDSTSSLRMTEAHEVIERLTGCDDRGELMELLMNGVAPGNEN